jgi:hypothetical protein
MKKKKKNTNLIVLVIVDKERSPVWLGTLLGCADVMDPPPPAVQFSSAVDEVENS